MSPSRSGAVGFSQYDDGGISKTPNNKTTISYAPYQRKYGKYRLSAAIPTFNFSVERKHNRQPQNDNIKQVFEDVLKDA